MTEETKVAVITLTDGMPIGSVHIKSNDYVTTNFLADAANAMVQTTMETAAAEGKEALKKVERQFQLQIGLTHAIIKERS